jgi:DNA-directed RNA polymerase subunit beta'
MSNYYYSSFIKNTQDFDVIKMGIASPDVIRSWSHGEVTKPETINYRTFKPEKDGLFCASIFGPVKDWECLCGKYKKIRYKGIICDNCSVEVTLARVRRERMGHIELAAPVVHPWFLRSLPSRIGLLLDMSLKDLEKVIYFESNVVISSNVSEIKYGSLMSDEAVEQARDIYGEDAFEADMGAEAIENMLKALKLPELKQSLQEKLVSCTADTKRKKIAKRLKVVSSFIESDNQPEWMLIKALPVSPPDIRPLVMLDSGRFAISDHNDLYRRILHRNNRLKRLISLMSPKIIARNEKRLLQEGIDELWGGRKNKKSRGGGNEASKRQLKSIGDMLKGKQGRFRQNLLGKRVDYSGRSVITVGPNLKLHQCGIPKKMALELFKPFVYAKLTSNGLAKSLKDAKKLVDLEKPEVWDMLAEVMDGHPVLLNRAPTLHRLSIQAFEPFLVEDQAIVLHPLVCTAFNADFDGDQMAVHVPLSIEAQTECRVLMMSTNNILSLANGQPVIVPTTDIILGLYYLTLLIDNEVGEGLTFDDMSDIEFSLDNKLIKTYTKINFRLPEGTVYDANNQQEKKLVSTTAGRLKLWEIFPKHEKIGFSMVNKVLKKEDVSALINQIYKHCGQKHTVVFADKLMGLGFDYSFKSGISFGMDDMIVPTSKTAHINKTKELITEFEAEYQTGLITSGERYNKTVDAWSQCTDKVTEDLLNTLLNTKVRNIDDVNNIHLMSVSGARGSISQVKQISGMRGLMVKPSGEIIETPIMSNFKEGLTILEYFNSTHGARKGLADTALRTAGAGYFTRRLVDVALDCIVTEPDCGSTNYISVSDLMNSGSIIVNFHERILGRVSAEEVFAKKGSTKTKIVDNGELITAEVLEKIIDSNITAIKVRSALTCNAEEGICSKCYGMDLSTGKLVVIGEAVGIIAAQSIGEPGVQLTLNTFHIGGAASAKFEFSSIENSEAGIVNVSDKSAITKNTSGEWVVIKKGFQVSIVNNKGKELEKYNIPYGASLFVSPEDNVPKNTHLAKWDPYSVVTLAEFDGIIKFVDIVENVSVNNVIDKDTGISKTIVIDSPTNLRPYLTIENTKSKGNIAKYYLTPNTTIIATDGSDVRRGDILAKIPRESTKTRDIIGGLPRVVDIFEARKPKDTAILAEFDGIIEFGKAYKNKRQIIINSHDDTNKQAEYFITKNNTVLVNEGEEVKKGIMIVDGTPALQDILRISGIEALAHHMICEVQAVYRVQGVKIDDKHLEIIIKHMLQKVEIEDSGDTIFSAADKVSKKDFIECNKKTILEGLKPAKGKVILSGITRAAAQNSFISAAAFQETTKVLTEAAISGRVDELKSLKENLITGRLIPVGTGFYIKQLKEAALKEAKEANLISQ